jgi:hypothetical protein
MVDILMQVGTAHWDRERLKMSADSLARVKYLTHFCHGEREPTVPGSRLSWWHGTVLSSKQVKVFNLSGSKTTLSSTWLVFPL